MTNFNKLSPAEAERLAILAEECAEVIKAVGKILRHGYESTDPTVFTYLQSNRQMLQQEIGDVMAVVQMLGNAGDIDAARLPEHVNNKLISIRTYLHHQ